MRACIRQLAGHGALCCPARLAEIRFEGLVGLIPPLSCSLPLQTGPVIQLCALSLCRVSLPAQQQLARDSSRTSCSAWVPVLPLADRGAPPVSRRRRWPGSPAAQIGRASCRER